MPDSDQTEQLGLDLDDPRAARPTEGPSEAFQTAVGAIVVLFLLVALVGGAMRLLGGDQEQVQLEGASEANEANEGATAMPELTGEPTADATPGTAGAGLPAPSPAAEGTAAGTPPSDSALSPEAARIVADAPPPADTPVQLLDGVGDEARVAAARQALEELGYAIAATSTTRTPYASTTVLHVQGAGPAGLALRARDPRFAVVEPAPDSLTAGVQLHIIVGQDWPAA